MRPGNTAQLQSSIPTETMDRLKQEAKKQGRSVSNLVALILSQYMEAIK